MRRAKKNHPTYWIVIGVLCFCLSEISAQVSVANNAANIGVNSGTYVTLGDYTGTNSSFLNNEGVVTATGDVTIDDFGVNDDAGELILSGLGSQLITGDENYLRFNKLTLRGTGIKTYSVDLIISPTGVLDLGDRILSGSTHYVNIKNGSKSALLETGGYVETSSYLQRIVSGANEYIFPLGSNGLIRPLTIDKEVNSTHIFRVELVNNDPTTDGYDRASTESQVLNINSSYYHKVNNLSGGMPYNVEITYDNGIQGTTNAMVEWNDCLLNGGLWEEVLPSEQDVQVSPLLSTIKGLNINAIGLLSIYALGETVEPQYSVLTKKLDGGFTTITSKLLFRYFEEYNDTDGQLTYNIYNKYNNIVSSQLTSPKPLQYGDNLYTINVSGLSLPENYYILEVINEKDEKWYLRFYADTGIADPGPANP